MTLLFIFYFVWHKCSPFHPEVHNLYTHLSVYVHCPRYWIPKSTGYEDRVLNVKTPGDGAGVQRTDSQLTHQTNKRY